MSTKLFISSIIRRLEFITDVRMTNDQTLIYLFSEKSVNIQFRTFLEKYKPQLRSTNVSVCVSVCVCLCVLVCVCVYI